MIRYILLFIYLYVGVLYCATGQKIDAGSYFATEKYYGASDQYINGNLDGALTTVNDGLKMSPGHKKLTELKKLLEQEKEEQQKQEKEKKEQEKKEQQEKEQQSQDQKNQEEQNQEEQEKEGQDKEKEQNKNQEEQDKEGEEQEEKNKDNNEENKEDQDQKDQQEKDENNNEKEDESPPPSFSDKLEDMNLTEEKARMILEAMKNSEQQYLQQLKRKSTKSTQKGKPDW